MSWTLVCDAITRLRMSRNLWDGMYGDGAARYARRLRAVRDTNANKVNILSKEIDAHRTYYIQHSRWRYVSCSCGRVSRQRLRVFPSSEYKSSWPHDSLDCMIHNTGLQTALGKVRGHRTARNMTLIPAYPAR